MWLTFLDVWPILTLEAIVDKVNSSIAENEPDGLCKGLHGEVGQLVGRHVSQIYKRYYQEKRKKRKSLQTRQDSFVRMEQLGTMQVYSLASQLDGDDDVQLFRYAMFFYLFKKKKIFCLFKIQKKSRLIISLNCAILQSCRRINM